MQSLKKKDLMLRRDKYSPSQYHFFFTTNAKDYLLFINGKKGFIVIITQGISKKLSQFEMESIVPFHFVSTGWGDINILHENGIFTQYFQQLSPVKSFNKIEFDRKIKPKKLIKIQENDYIIVTQSKTLVFLKDDKFVKQIHYPSEMMMERLELDGERREMHEARIVVPHSRDLFPFIFSVRQLCEFGNQNYLQNKLKKYSSYFYSDEKLPSSQYKLSFSLYHNKGENKNQNKIYLAYKNQLIILRIKFIQKSNEIDYIASLYYRCRARWDELPNFVSASNVNKTMIVITNSRFFELFPDKLGRSVDVNIKQKLKDNRMVVAGYGLCNCSCVFLTFDEHTTRLILV